MPLPDLSQIAFEEIVEERADRRDRGQTPKRVPTRGDGGFKNVGLQAGSKTCDQPAGVMWLEWTDGRISFIRDYKYVRYVIDDAELILAPDAAPLTHC